MHVVKKVVPDWIPIPPRKKSKDVFISPENYREPVVTSSEVTVYSKKRVGYERPGAHVANLLGWPESTFKKKKNAYHVEPAPPSASAGIREVFALFSNPLFFFFFFSVSRLCEGFWYSYLLSSKLLQEGG